MVSAFIRIFEGSPGGTYLAGWTVISKRPRERITDDLPVTSLNSHQSRLLLNTISETSGSYLSL